jgi:hypothetical protein
MAAKKVILGGPGCTGRVSALKLYSVLIDIERRIHAVRTLVGKMDPDSSFVFTEPGVAAQWRGNQGERLSGKTVCSVCEPTIAWPPYGE